MSPPFLFRIDEIVDRGVSRPQNDGNFWKPSTRPGDNVLGTGGATGKWWFCNGQGITPATSLPPGSNYYRAFSMFYSSGLGFWVLRGDATRPSSAEAWHPLGFDYEDSDTSSYLTNAGQRSTINWTRPDQYWPRMLLPDIYHDPHRITQHPQYGGLRGDLPIFLALLAFSMPREQLVSFLPRMFRDGNWAVHNLPAGRIDRRGLVVYVYTCPSTWAPNSTGQELKRYENGDYMCYYN